MGIAARRGALLCAGALVVGLTLLPLSAAAETATGPSGTAEGATISIQVAPAALLPSAVASLLSSLTGDVSVKLDDASALAVLNDGRTDVTSGRSVSQVVDINAAALRGVLAQLLQTLTDAVNKTVGTATTTVSSITGVDLSPVTSQLTNLLGTLNGISLDKAVEATLNQPGVTNVYRAGSNTIDLSSSGLGLRLAPFAAVATDAAHAAQAAVNTPQTSANNTTEALTVGQGIDLNSLQGLLTGLIGNLQAEIGSLTAAVTKIAAAGGTTVSSLVCTPPSPLPALPGAVCTAVTSVTSTPTTATDALNNDIKAVAGLVSALTSISNVINGLNLGSLITTHGVTSTALVEPKNGAVHGLATSNFADIQVLPLSPSLASTLAAVPGVQAGMPLLTITGATSSAEASADGSDTSAPVGTVSIGSISVLGTTVKNLVPGTSQTVVVPGTGLTLLVSVGTPTYPANSPTHKSALATALDITLTSDGTILGKGTIVSAQLASSSVDVQATAGGVLALTNTPLPSTGGFGPIALVIPAALLILALGLRLAPGAAARLRGQP